VALICCGPVEPSRWAKRCGERMRMLKELFSLQGRVVLISGGAGYLGTAMCEALAELGATVVIGSREAEKCQALSKRLVETFDVESIGVSLDITDISSVKDCLSHIQSRFGRLDVLINNAWSGKKNTFESITYEDWRYDIDVCLNGVFYCVKEAADMLKQSRGVVLNTSSMYGHVAPDYRLYDGDKYANPPSYGTAKAGVIQLTKYLASFLAPHSIRVNAISPGPFPFPKTVEENPAFIERLKAKNMLGRTGMPEDLKGVVAFLCSDASAYVTGQNICVDGGWAAW
jgi:NAD(P)-dependent dehydrogenase (short-subunit alcohol dehydrogenase family)